LAENIVGNLLEDDDGWFWTLGHHGIHRMRKQDLTELAEGKRRTIRSMSYGTAEGMLSSEGNVGLFPNTCQTPDGLLWFPTTRGVVVVDHNQMLPRDRPAPVVLEQVLADDELIFGDGVAGGVSRRLKSPLEADKAGPPPGSQLSTINHQLPAGRARVLEFRYTANTFIAPEQVQFRYQLVGHDRDWRDAGLRRTAIYTDIRPGTYRFRVVAINYHGVESELPAEFAFSLAPFFYQTRWFYGASTLAVLLTGLGLHRLRVGRLARKQTLEQQLALALQRERIAKDMHDDLGASLTQIGLLSEHARRDPRQSPEVAADLKKIAEATRQTAQAADEMVWVVSPRHDSLESLATYLCQLAREYLEVSGIRCRLEVPEMLPDVRVPSDVRHNLALFVKEALNNAVKHSAARQISVGLKLAGVNLTINVTDDGCGFDPQLSTPTPQTSANGNGLANLRKRVEELGGQFELCTQPGQGTRVGATVKLVG
jgi:signal transduction histidine kinase